MKIWLLLIVYPKLVIEILFSFISIFIKEDGGEDEHWRPYWKACSPCIIPYTAGKLVHPVSYPTQQVSLFTLYPTLHSR